MSRYKTTFCVDDSHIFPYNLNKTKTILSWAQIYLLHNIMAGQDRAGFFFVVDAGTVFTERRGEGSRSTNVPRPFIFVQF